MIIEIRDAKVAEFLRGLLRDGQSADEVVRMLLEDPCRAKVAALAAKYEGRIAAALAEFAERLREELTAYVERRLAEVAGAGGQAACGGDVASRKRCLEEAVRRAGGCMKFADIERVYGRSLNSDLLKRWGFVRRERGVWCLPEAAEKEEKGKKRKKP